MTSQPAEDQQPDVDMTVYKSLYLSEARACLTALQRHLVWLKGHPADKVALREAHRNAHTLKGMSATMRYDALLTVAGRLEDVLRRADKAESLQASDDVDELLTSCDDFKAGLDRLAAAKENQDPSQ